MKKRNVVPFVIALLAVSALLAFTSPDAPQEAPAAVAFSVLAEGDQAGMDERKNYRIRTSEELSYFWTLSHGEHAPPVPTVDFEAHDVLVVFDGQKPSGGYDIGVTRIVDAAARREVTIRHVEPGSGCITASVITSPFEFVVVQRSEAPLSRTDFTEVTECE